MHDSTTLGLELARHARSSVDALLMRGGPADLYVPVMALLRVCRDSTSVISFTFMASFKILLVCHDQDGCFLQMLVLQQREELCLQEA